VPTREAVAAAAAAVEVKKRCYAVDSRDVTPVYAIAVASSPRLAVV